MEVENEGTWNTKISGKGVVMKVNILAKLTPGSEGRSKLNAEVPQ